MLHLIVAYATLILTVIVIMTLVIIAAAFGIAFLIVFPQTWKNRIDK
ncbi:Uncharacterised protein [uncultured archaeon]|nr:Uncharacterised protein [uncultured archaeon]